ncbi:acyl carrier protein [Streptomyces sp. NBC_01218]|uniref:acyl carrier protein n=1 Tax=Streptomyces sp. NBC_01218 TaxID=2903780 RepID=UPI002E1026BA|nr:acyl carrier protein [Streptomyces sp. NBC_01218]
MPLEETPDDLIAAEETVTEAVARLLDVDEDELRGDTALPEIEGWDSVNALRLLVNLERGLGAPVDYERFAAAERIADLALLVADTAAGAGQGVRP